MGASKKLASVAKLAVEALGGYRVYGWLLEKEVLAGPMPSHVGLILDGNRRWAEFHGLPRWLGHRYGADRLEEVLRWFIDLGVKTVTVYALSLENLEKRPKEEVDFILALIEERTRKLKEDPLVREGKVRVMAMGDIERLPEDVRRGLLELEEITKGNDGFFLNLAVAYGGRREIVEAARRAARLVESGEIGPDDIDEDLLSNMMYTGKLPNPDPDLVIRTSGEVRLSGFLLWQSAYSELMFMDVYWPEFRRIDLLRAIRVYQRRSRRYGG